VFSKCAQLFGKLITCPRHLNHFYLFLYFAAPAPAAIDERQCDPFAPDQGIIDIPPTHRLQLYSARVQAVLRLARLYGECFSPLRQPVLGSNNIYNPETTNPDFQHSTKQSIRLWWQYAYKCVTPAASSNAAWNPNLKFRLYCSRQLRIRKLRRGPWSRRQPLRLHINDIKLLCQVRRRSK